MKSSESVSYKSIQYIKSFIIKVTDIKKHIENKLRKKKYIYEPVGIGFPSFSQLIDNVLSFIGVIWHSK